MSTEPLLLPTNKEDLARVIELHGAREDSRMNLRRVTWRLAYLYLQGMRRFDIYNPVTGMVRGYSVDEEGNLEYQDSHILRGIDQNAGRIAAMDLRPKVEAVGTALQAVRDRSVTQIGMDSIVSEDALDAVKNKFAHILVALGCCGLTGHVVDHPTIGLTTDFEVIHPSELSPFPSLNEDYTKQQGIMRTRLVPLQSLKKKYGARIAANLDKMRYWELPIGDPLQLDTGGTPQATATGGLVKFWTEGGSSELAGAEIVKVVKVRELWLDGPANTCARYCIVSGDYTIDDQDFEGQDVYCPIGVARFMENGTFHGAGYFDLMYAISRHFEMLIKQLFTNIRDLDRYGFLVMPRGSFNRESAMREIGKGLRVLDYEPDPALMDANFKPFAVQPFNSGDVPGRTAMMAKEIMDGLNPIRDLLKEKGRVDSSTGLQFLDEQITRAMTNVTRSVQSCMSTVYRNAATQLFRQVVVSPRPIPVSRVSLDLAGAVINPEQGTVTLGANRVPDLPRLSFTVRETSPKSEVALKQEALSYVMGQIPITDPLSFKLFSIENGLDVALWMKEEEAAYESAVWDCIILFGDGKTPGQIVPTMFAARPDIQVKIVRAFMSGPIFRQSSVDVQNSFADYSETLMGWMGNVLPEGIPNPADVAMLQQPTLAPSSGMGGMPMQPQPAGV